MLDIEALLGEDAEALLGHVCRTIPRQHLHLPGPDFVDRVWHGSDRPPAVLRALDTLFGHGRLGGTGYLSILPVDHGIAFSAGSAFAPNPAYFDPEAVLTLAVEAGCSAVVSTYGVLGSVARRYAHRVPLILKLNHHETLSYPNRTDQVMFARVREAREMGCVAVGATVYFGSPESTRQLREASAAFAEAHALGMATILFCYLHHAAFRRNGLNHELAADLTGQANHIGATIEADLIKQKMPTHNGGYRALGAGESPYGKTDDRIYTELASDHPIDLTRYQVANAYMGRCGLINSGGGSGGSDLAEAVRTVVVNKRAGGMGLIAGRKAFQRPLAEGIEIVHAIQDVYLDPRVTVA
jgi:fructose-bisphosphate aldolase, class I